MSTTNDSRNFVFTSAADKTLIDDSTHQLLGPAAPHGAISTVAEPLLATTATVVAVQVGQHQDVLEMRLDAKLLGDQEETRRTNDLLNSRR